MRRSPFLRAACVFAFVLTAASVRAQEPGAAPAQPLPPDPIAVPLAEQAREAFTRGNPLASELRAAIDAHRRKLRVLRAELAATRDERRALELQRAMALEKQAVELQLLRIQRDRALAEGRTESAGRLDAAIAAIAKAATPNRAAR